MTRRWPSIRKDAAYAFGAAAVHALVFAALLVLPRRAEPTAPEETRIVELDPSWLEQDAIAATATSEAIREPDRSPTATRAEPAVANAPRAEAAAPTLPKNDNPSAPAGIPRGTLYDPNATLEPSAPRAEHAPLSLAQLGVAGPGRTVQGTLAPEAESAEKASENALKASITRPLAEYDRDLGLGPEGPVIEELLRSVYASSLGLNGKVTFRAAFDERGRIVTLYVLSCDGERTTWEDVGTRVRTSLEGKEGRHTTEGYESDIEVVSALKNPSGTDPGAEVSLFGFNLKDGGGPEATKISILPLKPQLTTMTIGDTKFVVPVVNFTILQVHGDLSDIGTPPRRVVHARVVNKPRQWRLPPGIKPNARWELSTTDREKYDRRNMNGEASRVHGRPEIKPISPQ